MLPNAGLVSSDDGRFVELGAQFLHGKSEVFDIAEREGMLAGNITLYLSRGKLKLSFDLIVKHNQKLKCTHIAF